MTPRIVRVKPTPNPQSPIDPHSENWKDGWQTRDAELGLIVQQAVHDELASLGGHLLTTYGPRDVPVDDRGMAAPKITHRVDPGRPDLATLGGYLLEAYGDTTTTGDSDVST